MQAELAVQAHLEILPEIPEQAQLAVEVELRREEEAQAAPSAGGMRSRQSANGPRGARS
jgi:hypothetical protein